jgi:high-affinity iron transporter
LAVVREGAEIAVFFFGYLQQEDVQTRALTGGFVGLMLGLSAGALCYYFIVSLSPVMERRIQYLLLALVAAGMVGQGTQLLIQADWLPSAMPLWDTGGWLSERSVAGEIAYAIFGYEATPTAVEVGFYAVALALIPLSMLLCRRLGWVAKQEALQ